MSRDTPKTQVGDIAEDRVKSGVYHGRLADDYDGIGQHVTVSLSPSSVSGAYRARVASGGFGTGQVIPAGTPVTVAVHHGRVEILSLGGGSKSRLEDSFFVDASQEFSPYHSNFPDSFKRIRFKRFGNPVSPGSEFYQDRYSAIMSAVDADTFLELDTGFELHGGSGTIDTRPGGGLDIHSGGGMSLNSGGGMTLDSNGGLTLLADGSIGLHGAGGIDLNSANGALTIPKRSSDPAGSTSGRIYYNTVSNTIRWHNGTAWADL